MAKEEAKSLTFGEQLVGLTFNPSGDEKVIKVKKAAAAYADAIAEVQAGTPEDSFEDLLINRALMEVLSSQMLTVKAITWKAK